MILTMKQKINIRRFLRSVHALFSLASIVIIYLLVLTKKNAKEDRPQIIDGILIISKQLKSVP